jgi:hypothetical protein
VFTVLNSVEHKPIYFKNIKIDLEKFFRKILDIKIKEKLIGKIYKIKVSSN